jgi:hypothetical protein
MHILILHNFSFTRIKVVTQMMFNESFDDSWYLDESLSMVDNVLRKCLNFCEYVIWHLEWNMILILNIKQKFEFWT